jgi:hypothetical protein
VPLIHSKSAALAALTLLILCQGCAQDRPLRAYPVDTEVEGMTADSTGARERARQCPVSKSDLNENPASRWFGGHVIFFLTESQASQFDELPGEEKRVVAGRQAMGRLGVVNERCLVTSRRLPIDAFIVSFDGVPMGFSNQPAFRQFREVSTSLQGEILAPYLVRASGVSNTRCPVTGKPLEVGCPTIRSRELAIGFGDDEALAAFNDSNPNLRNEIAAKVVLPSRGITNTTCPITNRPLRLDSPIVDVNGLLVGIRNVDAARTFNKMNALQQQKMLLKANLQQSKETQQ